MALVAMHQCCTRAPVRQGASHNCLRNSAPIRSNGIIRVCLPPIFRSSRLVKATATGEQIDPATGEVVRPSDPRSYETGFSIEAGGLTWAYRDNGVESTETPALLIHGLGSCSYCWRQTMCLLAADGFRAVAPDWIGHGDSDKPGPGTFGYDAEAYIAGLDAFVAALGLERMQLVVQGFVLPQYALLWASRNPEKVERLVILNTPLSPKSQLRPELAGYKNPIPFLRPTADKPFAADLYAASGLTYAMMYNDSLVYLRAYGEGEGGAAALAATMDRLDWPALLRQVDEEMQGWRNESVIFFGAKDPFCDISEAILFLETKRTNIKLVSIEAKMGHMPQEDYPEALNDMLTKFMSGVDVSVKGVLRPGIGKNLTDD